MNARQAARIRLGIRAARQTLNGRGTEPAGFHIRDPLMWAAYKHTFRHRTPRGQ